tara:strand:+ start:1253 stop:2164 length:912 start_codon:yes stop_codon:yes gene_type:complete
MVRERERDGDEDKINGQIEGDHENEQDTDTDTEDTVEGRVVVQRSFSEALGPGAPVNSSVLRSFLSSPTFWRYVCLSLFLVNLRAIFRHLDATLPTYLIRQHGDDVPKGLLYSINPLIIMFLTPVVAAMCSSIAHYDMIRNGSWISGISPIPLTFSSTLWAASVFIVILSFGEAIWSPSSYDYSMSIAPKGREATFGALASAPLFAAKVPVGLLSGYLLETYMPETGQRRPKMLWLIIMLTTLTSAVCITVFERCVREPEVEKEHGNGHSTSTSGSGSGRGRQREYELVGEAGDGEDSVEMVL